VLHAGQPLDRIQENNTECDDIVSAERAKDYGIIDEMIRKRTLGALGASSH
jgi:ATP-dependent protease ClpP protease subunit